MRANHATAQVIDLTHHDAREHETSEPVTRDDLLDVFITAARPDPSTHMVGTELEKFGARVPEHAGSLEPISYEDIQKVLDGLCSEFGWAPGPDRGTGGEIIELRRDGASITLEPGGQFELSGKPLHTIHETCAEFTQHYRELHAVSVPLRLTWFTAGFHPWATREEIRWMPKGRYAVMRQFLPTRGGRGLDMMLRTCTVQANFDYTDEAQCGRRMRVANAIAPVLAALFANSPYVEGRDTGLRTARSTVWTDVDNDRCGTPDFVFAEGAFSFEQYVDWALEIPMFFVKRDGTYHPHHPKFSDYMRDGFVAPDGTHHHATWGDWINHLSTVFPEVRLKPYIEFRSADAVGSRHVCGLPALLTGLLYDDDALGEAWEMLRGVDAPGRAELWFDARHAGLSAPTLQRYAMRLVELSHAGLERRNVRDERDRSEARFVEPLAALAASGRTPGDLVLADVGASPGRGPEAQRRLARSFYFAGLEV